MSENLPTRLSTLAAEINHWHGQAEAAISAALDYAMRAGDLLLEVKAQLPHGEFGPWLAENFRGSARTAQIYMRVASHREEIEQKRNGVADLPLRQALRLIAKPREEGERRRLPPRVQLLAAAAAEIQRIVPEAVLTPTSLQLPDDLDLERWLQVGRILLAVAPEPEEGRTRGGRKKPPTLVEPPASEAQRRAQRLERVIFRGLDSMRLELANAYELGVWQALGYSTWQEYVDAELARRILNEPRAAHLPEDIRSLVGNYLVELARTVERREWP